RGCSPSGVSRTGPRRQCARSLRDRIGDVSERVIEGIECLVGRHGESERRLGRDVLDVDAGAVVVDVPVQRDLEAAGDAVCELATDEAFGDHGSCSPTSVTARNSQSLLSETSAPAERAVAALLLELSVDIEVDLLGVEADKAGDSLALGQRS